MLFAIHMVDRPHATELRAHTAAAYRAFVGGHLDNMYLAGPLLDETKDEPIGSLIVMDFPARKAAERFIAEEPYNAAGLFEQVTITGFSPVVEPNK